MKRSPRPLGVPAAIGFAIGLFASFAMGSRSSSGTYTLPSGNPVSTGQTITSTLWNNTHSDLATEVTNSLDRGGRGAMTAPLQVVAGTVTAPGLTFATETNSGLYRAATNDIRVGVAATNVQRWSTSGSTFPLACTVQGGATVTTTVTNGNGTSTTGNGTGNGVSGTGGATSGAGLYGTGGAPNGNGATLVGTGAGSGVNATGGATGAGGIFTGGASGAVGVSATGTGTFSGIVATGGATNGSGVSGTGTGTGWGGIFTGGSSGGEGVRGTGGGDQEGVRGIGGSTSSPPGVFGSGGSPNGVGVLGEGTLTGAGGKFTGGATDGNGVEGIGGGSAPGGTFASGTAATASVPQSAIKATNGNLSFVGTTNPNSDVGFSNTLTPKNIVKAWVRYTLNASAAPTVNSGFNVASVSASASAVTVTFATGLTAGAYACTASSSISTTTSTYFVNVNTSSGSAVVIDQTQVDTAGPIVGHINPSFVTGPVINVICTGTQ